MKRWRLVAALVAMVALAVAFRARMRRTPPIPPYVVWVEAGDEHELEAKLRRVGFQLSVDDHAEERAASLVLSTMPANQATLLAEKLQSFVVADSAVRGLGSALQEARGTVAPRLFEARFSTTHLHYSKARDRAAAVSFACPASSDAKCASLWEDEGEKDSARARELVGPIADAIVLETSNDDFAERLVHALVEGAASHIAFALSTRVLASPTSPPCREVQSLARLAKNALGEGGTREQREMLELLAQPLIPSAPWIRLGTNRVVVIPKMGSRGLLSEFVAEVTVRVGTTPVTWVRRPVQR